MSWKCPHCGGLAADEKSADCCAEIWADRADEREDRAFMAVFIFLVLLMCSAVIGGAIKIGQAVP